MTLHAIFRTEPRRSPERDRVQWGTSIVLFLALFLGVYLAPGCPGAAGGEARASAEAAVKVAAEHPPVSTRRL